MPASSSAVPLLTKLIKALTRYCVSGNGMSNAGPCGTISKPALRGFVKCWPASLVDRTDVECHRDQKEGTTSERTFYFVTWNIGYMHLDRDRDRARFRRLDRSARFRPHDANGPARKRLPRLQSMANLPMESPSQGYDHSRSSSSPGAMHA